MQNGHRNQRRPLVKSFIFLVFKILFPLFKFSLPVFAFIKSHKIRQQTASKCINLVLWNLNYIALVTHCFILLPSRFLFNLAFLLFLSAFEMRFTRFYDFIINLRICIILREELPHTLCRYLYPFLLISFFF